MKKLTVTIVILFGALFINAQSDIIYPSKSKKAIKRCKITQVSNINMVYYTKNYLSDSIEATSILKDGTYITFNKTPEISVSERQGYYKGHDYSYYQSKYKPAKRMQRIGIAITILGIGVGTGIYFVAKSMDSMNAAKDEFLPASVIVINVGISLWVSGGIIASNNKKAIEKIKRDANLSFGVTNNGVGLVLNF